MYLVRQAREKHLHQRKEQYHSAMAVLRYFSRKQNIFLSTLVGEGVESVSLQEGKLTGKMQNKEEPPPTWPTVEPSCLHFSETVLQVR